MYSNNHVHVENNNYPIQVGRAHEHACGHGAAGAGRAAGEQPAHSGSVGRCRDGACVPHI